MTKPPLLLRLRAIRPGLAPAEARVADLIEARPRQAADQSIGDLARAADTSQTTVLRLCRRLGLKGYPQLRLALAEAAAAPHAGGAPPARDVEAGDTVDDIITKVSTADALAVQETAAQLDRSALTQAGTVIAGAGRVDVYGAGASATVGLDLQQKLHRIGVVAFAWSDPHVAVASAALLSAGDVAVGISHSGTTRETVEALAQARSRGATAIAITNHSTSPLAREAHLVLTTSARETEMRSGATASRIAALTVIDCLYLVVAQQDLASVRAALGRTRQSLEAHRLAP